MLRRAWPRCQGGFGRRQGRRERLGAAEGMYEPHHAVAHKRTAPQGHAEKCGPWRAPRQNEDADEEEDVAHAERSDREGRPQLEGHVRGRACEPRCRTHEMGHDMSLEPGCGREAGGRDVRRDARVPQREAGGPRAVCPGRRRTAEPLHQVCACRIDVSQPHMRREHAQEPHGPSDEEEEDEVHGSVARHLPCQHVVDRLHEAFVHGHGKVAHVGQLDQGAAQLLGTAALVGGTAVACDARTRAVEPCVAQERQHEQLRCIPQHLVAVQAQLDVRDQQDPRLHTHGVAAAPGDEEQRMVHHMNSGRKHREELDHAGRHPLNNIDERQRPRRLDGTRRAHGGTTQPHMLVAPAPTAPAA